MPQEPQNRALNQSFFYRDALRRVVLLCIILTLVNLGLVGVIFYQYQHAPEPLYYAVNQEGGLTPLSPLKNPSVSQAALFKWAAEAAVSAYSFNFVDVQSVLEAVRPNFTNVGYTNYLAVLQPTIQTVLDKKLIVSCVLTGSPVILQEGVSNNTYAWRLSMPIIVTFQSASSISSESRSLVVLVRRATTLDAPSGLQIDQFVINDAISQSR